MVVDHVALERDLATADPINRLWLLRVLGRARAAVTKGRRVLAATDDPWRVLLLLAHAHHWLGERPSAEELEEEAQRRAVGTPREATTRQHIGKRLLDEGRRDDAITELTGAAQLREAAGVSFELVASSRTALHRAQST